MNGRDADLINSSNASSSTPTPTSDAHVTVGDHFDPFLDTLNVDKLLVDKLHAQRIWRPIDILCVSFVPELAQKMGIDIQDIINIRSKIYATYGCSPISASDLDITVAFKNPYSTGSQILDNCLGGPGIRPHSILQLSSVNSFPTSQIAIQVAIHTALINNNKNSNKAILVYTSASSNASWNPAIIRAKVAALIRKNGYGYSSGQKAGEGTGAGAGAAKYIQQVLDDIYMMPMYDLPGLALQLRAMLDAFQRRQQQNDNDNDDDDDAGGGNDDTEEIADSEDNCRTSSLTEDEEARGLGPEHVACIIIDSFSELIQVHADQVDQNSHKILILVSSIIRSLRRISKRFSILVAVTSQWNQVDSHFSLSQSQIDRTCFDPPTQETLARLLSFFPTYEIQLRNETLHPKDEPKGDGDVDGNDDGRPHPQTQNVFSYDVIVWGKDIPHWRSKILMSENGDYK